MRQLMWMLAALSLLGCSGTATEQAATKQPAQTDVAANDEKTTESNPTDSSNEATNSNSAADVYVIDVRSTEEWDTGHLSSAKHIPHTEIGDRIAEVTTNKDAKLVLY